VPGVPPLSPDWQPRVRNTLAKITL
jgi:hypothetical protein